MRNRRTPAAHAAGRISFFTMVLLVGLAGGAYYAIVFGPYYLDNISLKSVMREQSNIAWRNSNDEDMRRMLFEGSKNIGKHQETVNGVSQWVGGVGLLMENIFIVRDKEAKKVTIQVNYDREFELPLLNRRYVLHFSPVVEGTLENN